MKATQGKSSESRGRTPPEAKSWLIPPLLMPVAQAPPLALRQLASGAVSEQRPATSKSERGRGEGK